MQNKMKSLGLLVAAGLMFAIQAPAQAAGILTVPNHSFQGPATAFATSLINNWQKSNTINPSFFSLFPQGEDETTPDYQARVAFEWFNTSGVFLNTTPFVDNADGNQVGFVFGVPGTELYQDLTDTYLVGEAYKLTIDAEGGGNMPLNVPLAVRLYYRDLTLGAGDINRVTIATTTILNNNAPGNGITHLDPYEVNLSTVLVSDAWAGKPIGIQIISTSTLALFGGYWDVDSVKLAAIPEPATLSVLVLAAGFAVGRRRRL